MSALAKHRPKLGNSWSERLALLVARHIPLPFAVNPERALVNVACIVLGGGSFFVHGSPASMLSVWPWWLALEWSVAMFIGGICAFWGFIRTSPSIARVGMFLIALCSFIYSSGLIWHFGVQRLPSAIIFFCVGVAKALRLVVDSGYRAHLLQAYHQPEKRVGEVRNDVA